MPMQKGNKPGRPAKYSPNTKENKMVTDALKQCRVPNTGANRQLVHDEIGGKKLDYRGVVEVVKYLFNV